MSYLLVSSIQASSLRPASKPHLVAYVVGSLAEVAEGWNGEQRGRGAIDLGLDLFLEEAHIVGFVGWR